MQKQGFGETRSPSYFVSNAYLARRGWLMDGDGAMNEERIAGAGRALEEEGREAESRIAAAEPAALAFAHRLLAAIRVILNEHGPKIPESICGVVAYSLYAKIYGNCRATYRLCRLGHSLDAP